MFHLLYKYLIFHDYVNIPGIGHFTLEKQPAQLDIENKVIHAPLSIIKYKSETDVADKSFYNFLAGELNIDVVEAIRQFQDFSYQLKNNINANKVVELPSFGTLRLVKNEVQFEQTPAIAEYYPDVSIDKSSSFYRSIMAEEESEVVYEEDQEEVKSGRSLWWIYALILTILGIGAIAYYYYYLGNTFN